MDQAQGLLIREPQVGQPVGAENPERIRLLFLLAHFDTGGVQFQLYLRLKHLDPARYACRVAVLTDGNSYLIEKTGQLGVEIDFLHIDQERSLWRRVARIRAAISDYKPDIVDSLLGWDNTYGNQAATLEHVPLIIAELQNEKSAVRLSYPRSFWLFEALALRLFCDRVVCCSEGARQSYLGLFRGFEKKSLVIHDAIDGKMPAQGDACTERQALGIPEGATVIGTIGRLMEQKDHETFIRAAGKVCRKFPGAQFLIAGFGHLRDRLEGLIADLGLAQNVRILGEIKDVYRFYALTDVFVMTSRWEGFPVVLMEAMAAGKPVVSTRVGGIAEMIDQGINGFLCPVGDSDGIADAIFRLVDNPGLRTDFGARARAKVLRAFSIQKLARSWTDLYDTARESPLYGARPQRESRGAPVSGGPASHNDKPEALPSAPERILVLRLCPLDRFGSILRELKRLYRGVRLEILCQDEVFTRFQREWADAQVHRYGKGRFSIARLGLRSLWRLCRHRYDLVVLPYNTPGGYGYRQAEIISLLIGRGRVLVYEAWSDKTRPAGLKSFRWFLRSWFQVGIQSPPGILISTIEVVRAAIRGVIRRRRWQCCRGGLR